MSGSIWPKFRHVGIVVKDMTRQIEFYNQLGLVILSDEYEKREYINQLLNVKVDSLRVCKLGPDSGPICLELLHFDLFEAKKNVVELNSLGFTHFAMGVGNVDEVYAENKRIIDFVSSPVDSPDGKARVLFCKDPEGNFVELVTINEEKES